MTHSPSESLSQPTVAIETHGCKLNQADSGLLAAQFARRGFRLVTSSEPADVFIVNSCTVTHVADRKARNSLRAARRRNPDSTIVATGCYAQRSPEALRALAEIDLVVGNVDKGSLVSEVLEWRGGTPPVPCAVGVQRETLTPRIARTRAMVKIQEGCDQVCAYCIVPKVRGRERSVPQDELVDEIGRHAANGYKEVVLTGTQLGSYGFDLPDTDLRRLIGTILDRTEVGRVRISSLQPQDVGPELLDLWSDGRLCPHFHLPLQSGSDSVLRRMRRRYGAERYSDAVDMIRGRVPDVSITTDVMVGFPGESEAEFQETLALCRRTGFGAMHVFPYSIRPGTSAAHREDQVGPDVKSQRMRQLLEVAEQQFGEFRDRFEGAVRPVLWEEGSGAPGATTWTGLTDNYIRVTAHSSSSLTNQVTPARLGKRNEGLVYADVL